MAQVIPSKVQAKIDSLNSYKWNTELKLFDVLHLYPKELAFPYGLADSRWFECIGFNTKTMEKRSIGVNDEVWFGTNSPDNEKPESVRVFADGSFVIRFNEPIEVNNGLAILTGDWE